MEKGDTVQQVKERLSIVDVVSQYVKLMRAGASYKGRCPFHAEKTPSFMVSPERGTYHCFGCGVGGDVFTFVQEVEGLDFKGALKVLAERAGVPLVYARGEKKDDTERLFLAMEEAARFFESQLTDTHPAREYLKARGLSDDTIRSFRIGWAPDEWRALLGHLKQKGFTEKEVRDAGLTKEGDKGDYDRFRSRIMFPLNDAAGRPIAFSGRIFAMPGKEVPEDIAKYMNSPETPLFKKSKVLYGFDRAKQAIRRLGFATLVEGQMDLVSVHQAGWGNAVAVSGTALTEEHVALLRRMSENLLLALDADEAGIKAAGRSAALALSMGMDVKVARLPDGLDPADLIVREGKEAWGKAVKEAKHIIEFLLDVFEARAKDSRAFVKEVEREVLPFAAAIKSPIDREHFIKRVAERVQIPEDAIREGVRRVATPDRAAPSAPPPPVQQPMREYALHPRVVEAWGILLSQEASSKPAFDVAKARHDLEEAVGTADFPLLASLPAHTEEAARFKAEQQYDTAREAAESFALLIKTIARERLQKDFARARGALAEAERAGDEEGVHAAMELCTAISAGLAKLS